MKLYRKCRGCGGLGTLLREGVLSACKECNGSGEVLTQVQPRMDYSDPNRARKESCRNARIAQTQTEVRQLVNWLKSIGSDIDPAVFQSELEYRASNIRVAVDEAGFQAMLITFQEAPMAGELGSLRGDESIAEHAESAAKDFVIAAESSSGFFFDATKQDETQA